jgi:hypothetical protein
MPTNSVVLYGEEIKLDKIRFAAVPKQGYPIEDVLQNVREFRERNRLEPYTTEPAMVELPYRRKQVEITCTRRTIRYFVRVAGVRGWEVVL